MIDQSSFRNLKDESEFPEKYEYLKEHQETLRLYVHSKLELDRKRKFVVFLSIGLSDLTELIENEDQYVINFVFKKFYRFIIEILERHGVWKKSLEYNEITAAFMNPNNAVHAAQEIIYNISHFNNQRYLKHVFFIKCGAHCGDVLINDEELKGFICLERVIATNLKDKALKNQLIISLHVFEKLLNNKGFTNTGSPYCEINTYKWPS